MYFKKGGYVICDLTGIKGIIIKIRAANRLFTFMIYYGFELLNFSNSKVTIIVLLCEP
jgi:hypothetical protein